MCFEFLYKFCPQRFCTAAVRNISVQLPSAIFLYSCRPQYFCTAAVRNISVQLPSAIFLYSCLPQYFCTAAVRSVSVQRRPQRFCTAAVRSFSVQLPSAAFLILIRNERDRSKCVSVCMYSTLHFCQILTTLGISRQIFEKYINIKCHEIRPVAAQLLHADGQTDGQK